MEILICPIRSVPCRSEYCGDRYCYDEKNIENPHVRKRYGPFKQLYGYVVETEDGELYGVFKCTHECEAFANRHGIKAKITRVVYDEATV